MSPNQPGASHEEPHHAAARHRTDEEQLALESTDYLTGDELRALRRVRSDRDIVTVDPGAAL
jgi:hypothetical protein